MYLACLIGKITKPVIFLFAYSLYQRAALELRKVFTFLIDSKEKKKEYIQEGALCGLQSLKYSLRGLLQEMFANPCFKISIYFYQKVSLSLNYEFLKNQEAKVLLIISVSFCLALCTATRTSAEKAI